jgi:hypothetical protein
VAIRRGRRRKKLLDDLKDRTGYSHLKEEALDRTMWRNRFGGDFGPAVRQNNEWIKVLSKLGLVLQRHPVSAAALSDNTHSRVLFAVLALQLHSSTVKSMACLKQTFHTHSLPHVDRNLQDFQQKCLTHKIRISPTITIGVQPLGRFGQRPDLSQATGVALVSCILGMF